MRVRKLQIIIFILFAGFLAFVLLYQLPPIKERVNWWVDDATTRIKYAINPPDEAIFIPQEIGTELPPISSVTSGSTSTPQELKSTHEPVEITSTIQPDQSTSTPDPPTFTASITATELPGSVFLEGVTYVDQHNRWNYCGPANLTMALNFWGWPGNRDDVAAVVKPGIDDSDLDFIQRGKLDKNVMPYEMANFVIDHTEFNVVTRIGGEIDLIKRLIAFGYPVVIEKGYYETDYTGKYAWLGHYLFVTGYDDSSAAFTVQDAYLTPGENLNSSYDTFLEGWRSFNYLFMVIYPPADEARVFGLLGDWANPDWANQHALQMAEIEIATLSGNDEFFAWFNKGTSHVRLQQYTDAAVAYDQAFYVYSELESDDTQRPYRLMWYQTTPYWAYFYSGRYQDTINLANNTLYKTISEPTLEESIYWRGRAYLALGQVEDAINDFLETVRLNPNFAPGWEMLAQLGVGP